MFAYCGAVLRCLGDGARLRAKCSGGGRFHLERRLINKFKLVAQVLRIVVFAYGGTLARNWSKTCFLKSSRLPGLTRPAALSIISRCLISKFSIIFFARA
jgi:hypothetical protein